MRRILLAVVVIAGVVLLSIAVADACGDKSLRIGRGIRFQRSSHPTAVLIYLPSNATRAAQLQSMLKRVGHKAYSAPDAGRLSEALTSGQYDLVFAEFAEAAKLARQIETSRSKPVLVPVISSGTKAEVTAARTQYRYVVKNPHNADNYLDAIDEAMRSRVHLLAKKS